MPKRKKSDETSEINKRHRRALQIQACSEVLSALKSYKTEDDRSLFELIDNAYKSCKNNSTSVKSNDEVDKSKPNLEEIAVGVAEQTYQTLHEFYGDIENVFETVKEKFAENDQNHKDANELFEFYADIKQDICPNEDVDGENDDDDETDKTSANDSAQLEGYELSLEELFTAVMTAVDEHDERRLSTVFHSLPAKDLYPDYYEVITEPIDLKTIGQRIQSNVYKSINELEKDLLLMVKNAKLYNEPGSQIYKDANALRKLIVTKKAEIEQKRFAPVKTSERIKAKRNPNQKWSNIAALFGSNASNSASSSHNQHDESTMDDTSEIDPDDFDSIEYNLYSFIRNYKDAQGVRLADPFLRMPNRRFYPDYYTEIKQPTSLGKINGKIRLGAYENAQQLVDELDLLFRNAMRYNRSDSKIYKDAAKLQKELHIKSKDLINYEPTPPPDTESLTEEEPEDEMDEELEEDEDDEEEIVIPQPKKRGRKPGSHNSSLNLDSAKKMKKASEVDPAVKKRMKQLYKTLYDYQDNTGRHLIGMFIEKPSKKRLRGLLSSDCKSNRYENN